MSILSGEGKKEIHNLKDLFRNYESDSRVKKNVISRLISQLTENASRQLRFLGIDCKLPV